MCTFRLVGVGKLSPQTLHALALLMGSVVDNLLPDEGAFEASLSPLQNFS